jgi:hypothetical protein
VEAGDPLINGRSAVRGEKTGTLCRTNVEVGHDIHGGETDLVSLMQELGENTSVVEARREIGGQGRKLTMVVVKSWWGCRKRYQAGTIKPIYAMTHI